MLIDFLEGPLRFRPEERSNAADLIMHRWLFKKSTNNGRMTDEEYEHYINQKRKQ